jgi:TldD protein
MSSLSHIFNQDQLIAQNNALFFGGSGIDPEKVKSMVWGSLADADAGELYFEQKQAQSLGWSHGKLGTNALSIREGFAARYVQDARYALAHHHEISEAAIQASLENVRAIRDSRRSGIVQSLSPSNHKLSQVPAQYAHNNPLDQMTREERIRLLSEVEGYIRDQNPLVSNVSASIMAEVKNILILRNDGLIAADRQPLVHMRINVEVEKNNRKESGGYGFGGRVSLQKLFEGQPWQQGADEALRSALVNLEAVEAPAGEMPVVLGHGWTGGVMLHEAVGHGLEGDFNRLGSSVYSGLVGQQVASKGVTVVDQGDITDRRGSLSFDDEGTPTQENVLIEDGVLQGYMQDRMNARLMGVAPTGNGRRETYSAPPMPRMTTTYMRGGDVDPADIIKSVDKGFYAARISGGQVDITSGSYVFDVEEGYLIEQGKITQPVKGATLIGNGPDTMRQIDMIGNDMAFDPGLGSCGKSGQTVAVGVGQPTVKLRNVKVGGTLAPS